MELPDTETMFDYISTQSNLIFSSMISWSKKNNNYDEYSKKVIEDCVCDFKKEYFDKNLAKAFGQDNKK